MRPVTFDVAILYFLSVNEVLPVRLTWFIVLISTAGFEVSPPACSVVPVCMAGGEAAVQRVVGG